MACKQWNEREGEETELQAQLGFQNPATLTAKTYTLISFHESVNPEMPGGLDSNFVMRRCFHCLEPGCVSACPTTALYRQPDGPVSYDVDKCIGCRYCMLACPWDVPTAEWDKLAPKIEKCTHCADRTDQPAPIQFNGVAASEYETKRFVDTHHDARVRQGLPRRRAALRDPRRDARAREEAAGSIVPSGTSITSTARRSSAGRACCTSPESPSRNSASRSSARSRSRGSPRPRSAPCLPP